MSPDKIRELLTAACPELVWVVDGDAVRAEGVAIAVYNGGMESTMLRFINAQGTRKLWREDRHPDVVAATIWSMLTADEIANCPGAARFVARKMVMRAQTRVAGCVATCKIAERAIADATRALREAEGDLDDARTALAKAEVHAAKVGA